MAYFSNSTEGMVLDNQCAKCIFGDKECPIALAQALFNYDAVENNIATDILNTLVNENGECMMFKNFRDVLDKDKAKQDKPKTESPDLF